MQKKFFRFSLILILALFFGSILRISPSNAQTMFLGYTSAGQVYNASASSIAVTIKLYNPDGTTASTLNDTISGNSSKTYFPLNNFAGSMSVTSTGGNLVAIGNLVAVGQIAGASYVGNNSGATALYIPLLQNYWHPTQEQWRTSYQCHSFLSTLYQRNGLHRDTNHCKCWYKHIRLIGV